jgi:hypothetical protein
MTRGVLAAWLTVALQIATIGCSDVSSRSGTQVTPEAGSLYTVNDGEGWFRIAKVLAVEEKGVHIRLYKNRYKDRPTTVDKRGLSLGKVDDPDGFGMGHLPLTRAAFVAWQPKLLERGEVSSEELDGFLEWQKSGGGYFGKG